MSTYDFYNWEDGEFAIGTVFTEITAFSRKRGVLGVRLVDRASPDIVELVRSALIDRVTAMNPASTFEVESSVRVLIKVDAYSAPRADGSRIPSPAWEELSIDASDEEVRAAGVAASKIAAAKMNAAVLTRDRKEVRSAAGSAA